MRQSFGERQPNGLIILQRYLHPQIHSSPSHPAFTFHLSIDIVVIIFTVILLKLPSAYDLQIKLIWKAVFRSVQNESNH